MFHSQQMSPQGTLSGAQNGVSHVGRNDNWLELETRPAAGEKKRRTSGRRNTQSRISLRCGPGSRYVLGENGLTAAENAGEMAAQRSLDTSRRRNEGGQNYSTRGERFGNLCC